MKKGIPPLSCKEKLLCIYKGNYRRNNLIFQEYYSFIEANPRVISPKCPVFFVSELPNSFDVKEMRLIQLRIPDIIK